MNMSLDLLANAAALAQAQERLHELGVPREITVSSISMGEQNGQKANAPPMSKKQNNIVITMSDESKIIRGSGWHVWESKGKHYHLGGGKSKNGEGKPVIYRIREKIEEDKIGRNGKQKGPGWIKASDQTRANELYEKYGKRPVE